MEESQWIFRALRNSQSSDKETRGKGLAMLLYLEVMAESPAVQQRASKAVNHLAPYTDEAMP